MKEFRLPKTVHDLRIRHLKALQNPVYQTDVDLDLACQFVSEFTGEHINTIRQIDSNDVWKIFNHCALLYSQIHIGTPKKEVTIGGESYSLVDPHKVGSGWHIDFGKFNDIEKDPVKTACLFYYPSKAARYGETDDNKNLLYPIKDRYKLVERDMTLQDFLNSSAFFLQKYEKSTRLYMEKQKVTRKVIQLAQRMSGKSSSM